MRTTRLRQGRAAEKAEVIDKILGLWRRALSDRYDQADQAADRRRLQRLSLQRVRRACHNLAAFFEVNL